MKVGDTVRINKRVCPGGWERVGLILGFRSGRVLVFWGEDFPYEDEYPEQLEII